MIKEFLDYLDFAKKHDMEANNFNTLKFYMTNLQGVGNATR